jgi:phage gpG-like protein
MAGISSTARGLTLSISIPGAETLSVTLSRFKDIVTDMRPFWEGPFKTIWYEDQRRQFATEGLATGGSWARLTPLYEVVKAKRFPGQPILTATGRLRAGMTSPDGPDSVWKPGEKSIDVGTTDPIASFHQLGTPHMKARPILRMQPETMAYLGRELQQFMVAAWKKEKAERAQSAKA